MQLIRIPYDDLGQPTPNGTWQNDPNGPQINAYNDQIDFTGFPFDTYSYTYLVQRLNCFVRSTITYSYQDTLTVPNDVCSKALDVPFQNQANLQLTDQSNLSDCLTYVVNLSNTSIPTNWNNPDSDLWYVFTPPPNTSSVNINISGNNYQNGIKFPQMAIYSDCNTFVKAKTSVTSSVTDFIFNPASQPYYIRVSSQNNNAGAFTIKITFNTI